MEATAAQIHEHQEDIKQPGDNISGACHCGRVVFLLCCEQPLASKLCHCDTCKTIHGAPFQWAAIVHKTDIVFLSDPQHLTWYNSGHRVARHELPCKARCTYCGTLILDEGRRMTMIFPTLLTFANENQKSKFSPQCHIFYSERAFDVPDGLPKWSGLDQTHGSQPSHKSTEDLP